LSRRLYPDEARHNLDSVIARHELTVDGRHRALGDARALWTFVQALYRDLAPDAIEAAARRVLKTPSLPSQLPPDALDALPEGRVSIFSTASTRCLSISARARICGSVSARIFRPIIVRRPTSSLVRNPAHRVRGNGRGNRRAPAESALVKSMLPAHNHALRRKADSGVLVLPELPACRPSFPPPVSRPEIWRADSDHLRRSGRRAKRCARSPPGMRCAGKRWGWRSGRAPAFARQVKRCAGACVGAESAEAHHERSCRALAAACHPALAFRRLAAIRERSLLGERTDLHVIRDWCWLGTAQDEGELGRLVEAPRARPSMPISRAF
jgi:DNA polymerase-3 subunit epsilon